MNDDNFLSFNGSHTSSLYSVGGGETDLKFVKNAISFLNGSDSEEEVTSSSAAASPTVNWRQRRKEDDLTGPGSRCATRNRARTRGLVASLCSGTRARPDSLLSALTTLLNWSAKLNMAVRSAWNLSKLLSAQSSLSQLFQIQPPVVASAAVQLEHVRFRRRKMPSRQKKKKSVEVEVKKVWMPVSMRTKAVKVVTKEDDPVLMARVPEDDIWFRKYYPDPKLAFHEAVEWVREAACPEMEDSLQELLWFKCRLDMSTKKKTKFVGNLNSTVVLPHQFDDGTVNRVMAICKTEADRVKAREAGAELAGGIDLINVIERREINPKDFTHVVATADMLTEIGNIRKYLKDLYPNKTKGTIGSDVEAMVYRFFNGKEIISTKDDDNVGHLEVPIGQLDMPVEELLANLKCYINHIWGFKRTQGPFITRGFMLCPPSSRMVELDSRDLEPDSSALSNTKALQDENDPESLEEAVSL